LTDGTLPTVATMPDLAVRHIGALHRRPVWAGELTTTREGTALRSWLTLTAELPAPAAAAVARGYYQVRWRRTNRHCGACGGELQDPHRHLRADVDPLGVRSVVELFAGAANLARGGRKVLLADSPPG